MKLSIPAIVFAALLTAAPAHGTLRGTGLDKISESTRALQGPPDGDTPATEIVCDDYDGVAYGLCNSYCEARDCDDDPDRSGCAVVKDKFLELTGEDNLPCDCLAKFQLCEGPGDCCEPYCKFFTLSILIQTHLQTHLIVTHMMNHFICLACQEEAGSSTCLCVCYILVIAGFIFIAIIILCNKHIWQSFRLLIHPS